MNKVCNISDSPLLTDRYLTYPNASPTAILHKSIENRDVARVAMALFSNADVNSQEGYTMETPLGKSINALEDDRYQPKNLEKSKAIFRLVVQHGADPKIGPSSIAGSHLSSCLYHYPEDWADECAWKLIDQSDLEQQNGFGWRPIHYAAFRGNFPFVKELIKRKVNLNVLAAINLFTAPLYVTPAHMALRNPKVLRKLVLSGADPYLRAITPGGYQEGSTFPLKKAEPLSAYMMAVDNDLIASIDTILNLVPPKPEDLAFPERSCVNLQAESIKDLDKYCSLNERLNSEFVKRQHRLSLSGIRCHVVDSNQASFIQAVVGEFFQNTEKLYKPIRDLILHHFKINPEFSLLYRNRLENPDAVGTYNAETANEISLLINLNRYKMKSTLAHELTHKAADILYPGNQCAPPLSSYYEALKEDLAHLYEKPRGIIHSLFEQVDVYPEQGKPAEYLARISDAIERLEQDGYTEAGAREYLKLRIPHLFFWYETEFLPAIQRFIDSKALNTQRN